MTFSPASLSATFPSDHQALNPADVDITAKLSPSPSGPVYPFVVEDSPIFMPGQSVSITHRSDGSYVAHANFAPLAAGTYTGHLRLKLCEDSACASEYELTGATLPYKLVVTPGIKITATVNGVAVPTSGLDVRHGDHITLTSSVPVFWSTASGGMGLRNEVTTDTSWSAEPFYNISTPGEIARLSVTATTMKQPQMETTTDITLSK